MGSISVARANIFTCFPKCLFECYVEGKGIPGIPGVPPEAPSAPDVPGPPEDPDVPESHREIVFPQETFTNCATFCYAICQAPVPPPAVSSIGVRVLEQHPLPLI